MKNKSNPISQNILNLTSLWEEASQFNNSFISSSLFNYAAIEDMNWPNRLWFNKDFDQETIMLAKNKVFSDFPNLIIPYWDIYGTNSNQLLEQNGFVKIFEQVGMFLKPDTNFEIQTDIKIDLVSSEEKAKLWSKSFALSFGYKIHPKTLINTHKTINYYIAHHQDKIIGTAIIYQTDKITGIHAMGIIPQERRKGHANNLMKVLLNKALRNKSEYVTLQASDMGKGLYLKLGFKEQFIIKNYALQQRV